MKWIKRFFSLLLVMITIVLVHYYLPQRDIVQVVNTDVKRMDISKGSPFWDRQDAGTDQNSTRDVRFIYTEKENGKTMVYRNEDTGWSFPFYLKFDSSDLSAKAESFSRQGPGTWVAVTHYGWRIRLFSIFPNATKVKRVDGPDTLLIPWFNIVFLGVLFFILFMIWRFFNGLKRKHVDPVTDKVGKAADEIADNIEEDIAEQKSKFNSFTRRWFGSSKKD